MAALSALLALVQLIIVGVPIYLGLRRRNWGTFPLRVSTLEHFSACDPWTGEVLTEWDLDLFLVANNKMALPGVRLRVEQDRWVNHPPGPGKRGLKMLEEIALSHKADQTPRFLPRALAKLWVGGQCPTHSLPWLLCDIEPQLRKTDYHFAGVVLRFVPYLAGIYALVAAILLAVYIFVAPPESHHFRDLTRSQFISEPQREQAVFVVSDDLVRLHDPVPWPSSMMRLPPGIRATEKGPYEIGWYKASSGRRLLAIPSSRHNNWPKDIQYVSTRPFGTVWPTARLGLTPQFLNDLKARVPGLDTSYVTVDAWWWADQNAGGALGITWLWLSGIPGAPALVLFGIIFWLLWRERRLRRVLSQRLAVLNHA